MKKGKAPARSRKVGWHNYGYRIAYLYRPYGNSQGSSLLRSESSKSMQTLLIVVNWKNQLVFNNKELNTQLLCGTDSKCVASKSIKTSAICSHIGDWSDELKILKQSKWKWLNTISNAMIRHRGVFSFRFQFFRLSEPVYLHIEQVKMLSYGMLPSVGYTVSITTPKVAVRKLTSASLAWPLPFSTWRKNLGSHKTH